MRSKEDIKYLIEVVLKSNDASNIKLANNFLTISMLKEYYQSLDVDANCNCVVCNSSITSTTTIGKSEAIHLIEMAYQHKHNGLKWLFYDNIERLTYKHWGTKSTKSTQLELFGLIETSKTLKRTNALEVDGVKVGNQRLTHKGYLFVMNKLAVEETVYKRFSKVVGFSQKKIKIYEVNTKSINDKLLEQDVRLHYQNRK